MQRPGDLGQLPPGTLVPIERLGHRLDLLLRLPQFLDVHGLQRLIHSPRDLVLNHLCKGNKGKGNTVQSGPVVALHKCPLQLLAQMVRNEY